MSGPIQDAMSGAFDRYSSSVAVVGAEAITYGGLRDRIEVAVRALREVFPDGSRHIGFCLGNRPGYVILYFATLYAGHLPLLLDASFNTGEIESIRNDCGLDALVVEPGRAGAIAFGDDAGLLLFESQIPAFRPRPDTQVCRFTSGTTGRPKCLEFSGHAVVSAARNWVLGTGMTGDDRTLALAALSNGLAFNTSLLSTFLAGGQIHFLKGLPLTRPVARRIAESGITRLVAFPTLYRNFVAPGGPDASEMASLKHAISAGAPLWPDVREEFRNRYGLDISDYYGIAETGPVTFERDPNHHAGLGEPLPGVELRIASDDAGNDEPGEVLVRTESMASGYLNHPGLFEGRVDAEGFYHSGDRGRIVDRRLHLVGRTQDHINVAGRKIDPTEVVAVVTAMDGVLDAVAFPDEDLNRETLVHLVVVAPANGLTKAGVSEACRSRLAPWKVPGRVSFVDEIPRTAIGKPRIAMLREQLLQRKESVA
jgi:acyl-CoA synthetase (AMP-forming)/AMP-acid ligase II